MRIPYFQKFVWSLGAFFLLSLSVPAFAEQMDQQSSQQQQQMQQPTQQPMQQQMGQQPQQPQRGQQQSARQQAGGPRQQQLIAMGLEPITRVAVAFDFDDDGQIDAVDYVRPDLAPIIFVDRQQVRQQMTQQMGQPGGQQMARQQFRQPAPQMTGMAQGPRSQGAYKVQGTIQDMRTAKITGFDEQRVLALVQTQKGQKVAVDLGPQWKVKQLNLNKGDQISAFGRIGTIDQRPVLTAFNVRAGDQRITVPAIGGQQRAEMAERNVRRYDVTLLGTRNVSLPGGPSVTMSKVRLPDGNVTLVNLGPSNALQNLNLQPNQNLRLLARPIRLEGESALIAERVATGNQQVDIDWGQVRTGQGTGATPG